MTVTKSKITCENQMFIRSISFLFYKRDSDHFIIHKPVKCSGCCHNHATLEFNHAYNWLDFREFMDDFPLRLHSISFRCKRGSRIRLVIPHDTTNADTLTIPHPSTQPLLCHRNLWPSAMLLGVSQNLFLECA